MTQTYKNQLAIRWMREGLCPECGNPPGEHSDDPRFWAPRIIPCDLLPQGVTERIAKQHHIDHKDAS